MCDCKSETIRILKRCQHSTDASPPAVSSSPAQGIGANTIDVSLILAHDLVEHWGKIKNCSNSGSHMTSQTLSCLTDAIKLVLQDYEMAIECMSQSSHPSSHPSGPLIPRVVLGTLELDPSEAAIVVRESLKHSVIRLAAMLRGIEEEASLLKKNRPHVSMPDKDVEGPRHEIGSAVDKCE